MKQWNSDMARTLAVFFLLVALTTAQYALEIQNLNPGEPERCKDGDIEYMVGQSWAVTDECIQKSCVRLTEPRVMAIHYAGCGKIIAGSMGCWVSEPNLTLPYPKCCPVFKCTRK